MEICIICGEEATPEDAEEMTNGWEHFDCDEERGGC